jgi:hypothetical protein
VPLSTDMRSLLAALAILRSKVNAPTTLSVDGKIVALIVHQENGSSIIQVTDHM